MSQTSHHASPLDRRLPLPGWYGLGVGVILLAAFLLRFLRLDTYLLNPREASWAYDSWSLYSGRPLPAGQELPDSSPTLLLWNAIPYFLFGDTDATARIGSAIVGVALVAIVLLLRPFLSRAQVLSAAGILAISPTVVFASRTVEPGVMAAFLALLGVIAFLNLGEIADRAHIWAGTLGFALAALYGVGPVGVSTLIVLVIALVAAAIADAAHTGAVGASIRRLRQSPGIILTVLASAAGTLLVLFTRAFTSLEALAGLGIGISDWVRYLNDGSTQLPFGFYFWSLMLYETIAVILAIVALTLSVRRRHDTRLPIPLFVGWFLAALAFFSASSSRDTGSAVVVVLPVLVLAGVGLGHLLTHFQANLAIRIVGYVATVVLVAYSLNGAIGLSFTRGQSGTEPLAWDTPAESANDFIDQVMRVSRDISVTEATIVDPTGRYGLNIKVTPELEWPFTWYFREFASFSVVSASGFDGDTDVAIASDAAGMDTAGLTANTRTWRIRPSDDLTRMRTSDILRTALRPVDAWNYMIHRETSPEGEPRQITVGYSTRIMSKLETNPGPFNLFDGSSPGAGSGLGQLNAPTGIAVAPDGTILVLNAGNARVDRYDADGTFLGVWSAQLDPTLQLGWNGFQGGTGIETDANGLVYIADTWNHAVLVISAEGTVVRVLGDRATAADITDAGDVADQPGLFFGPRGIAVTDELIYVTDTGNERVQVFRHDGTFVHAFGGFGSEEGQFVEPTGIVVVPDGSIWVADSGNARLQQFAADGTWLASFDIPEWQALVGTDRLNDLAFDGNGVLYFTVPNQGVFAWRNGQSELVSNAVLRPGGIAFDDSGNLLITDNANATVIRVVPELSPALEATPLATPATPAATPAG